MVPHLSGTNTYAPNSNHMQDRGMDTQAAQTDRPLPTRSWPWPPFLSLPLGHDLFPPQPASSPSAYLFMFPLGPFLAPSCLCLSICRPLATPHLRLAGLLPLSTNSCHPCWPVRSPWEHSSNFVCFDVWIVDTLSMMMFSTELRSSPNVNIVPRNLKFSNLSSISCLTASIVPYL